MVRLNQNRSKLLLGCGSAALAMGLAATPQMVSAQAIQATENVTTGSANRVFTGTGTETIFVATDVAVIDWTPDEDGSGNALAFLPTNNVVTFRNDVNNSDFAVLNRILPSTNGNVTVFDGTVISQLFDTATGGLIGPGGTVAFYSPTGIFIGANAVFDVGNLILTTLDPDQTSFADFAINGGQLQMFGQTGTTAQIIFAPGSQVIASAENSYFAVTAAEIQMFGSSNVNGSTAFIGGEQVNITVSNGLFDIQIPVGSSSPNPINIFGDVGGPSSTGTGDNHVIYAVAAAQNDPISLLFSGNLGFDPAASAGIVNGEIILSANYEVSGRTAANATLNDGAGAQFFGFLETTDVAGSIFLEDFAATSSILAVANEEVQVTAFNGPSTIDGDLLMFGRNFSELTSSNGQNFLITGDVFVSADDRKIVGVDLVSSQIDAAAGLAFIDAFDNGTMTIGGDVLVSSSAFAGLDTDAGLVGSATGGSATVASSGGTLNIAGSVDILADALPQSQSSVLTGNTFTGGTAQIFSNLGGNVVIDGPVVISAGGFGADGDGINTSTGSDAFGGLASVAVIGGGSLTFNSDVEISAIAIAGRSNSVDKGALGDGGVVDLFLDSTGTVTIDGNLSMGTRAQGGNNLAGEGGDALGGASRLFLQNGGTVLIGGDFFAEARADGGFGTSGGNASAGMAGARVVTGLVDISGNALAVAEALGGNADIGFGGSGGDANGGSSFLQADGSLTATGTLNVGLDATLVSSARGGNGGVGDGDTIEAGTGGTGTGGQIGIPNQADPNFGSGAFLLAGGDNGNLTVLGTSNVINVGIGGRGGDGGLGQNGGDGGDGIGGTAQAGSALLGLDGSLGAGTVNLADVSIFANGDGGSGGNGTGTGTISGNGGDGSGFGAFFTTRAGTTTAGNVSLNAEGTGGEGHVAGSGTGGLASLQAGFGGNISVASLSSFAIGRGGLGDNQGGDAFGGTVDISGDLFDLSVNGDLYMEASALGGAVGDGPGGNATGGVAQVTLNSDESSISVAGNADLRAFAVAADGNTASQGALAIGGDAVINLISQSTIDIGGRLSLEGSAFAGDNFGSGRGGDAIGPRRAATFIDNGGALTVGTNYSALALADAGDGTGGGDAFGGVATLQIRNGSADIGQALIIDANAFGGNSIGLGGDGGSAQGGFALTVAEGDLNGNATISVGGDANLFANGFGGLGGASDGIAIAAGRGGDGLGGDNSIPIAADPNEVGGATLGAGGDFGTLTIAGNSSVQANGFGGTGGDGAGTLNGGDGGDGTGGDAFGGTGFFNPDNTGAVGAGSVNLGANSIFSANGFGGSGGSGEQRGNGGDGMGDRARVGAAAGGNVTAGQLSVFANGNGGDGFIGGNGMGGSRAGLFMNTNGSFTIGSFVANALGFGGFGEGGVGGIGEGGQAFIGFQDGVGQINGDVTIDASGIGGSSDTTNGGDGIGGIADIAIFTAVTGQGTITGHSNVLASGIGGGAGEDAVGGTGTGGEAYVLSQAGGTITLGSAQVAAVGVGGSGTVIDDDGVITTFNAEGGDGLGGLAYISAFDAGSRVSILRATPSTQGFAGLGFAMLSATGFGGATTGGSGIGGDGTGGEVFVAANSGGTVELPLTPETDPNSTGLNRILARGQGGSSSVEGGIGGLATGGLGTIEVDGGTIVSGATLFSVFAGGGRSANTNLNISGGDGTGGQRDVTVTNGGNLTIELSGGIAGGVGGDASGTGVGGDGTAGTASLRVTDSTVNFLGRSIITNQVGGGIGSSGGDAVAGSTDVSITNSTINLVDGATLSIGSNAFGGAGEGGTSGQGGNATAGSTSVTITDSTISGGALYIGADAIGGTGFDSLPGQGGTATAGFVDVEINDSVLSLKTAEDTVGFVFDPATGQQVQQTFPGQINTISATATGGNGLVGGNATSGNVTVNVIGGQVTVAPSATQDGILRISADATGGDGNNQGGDGRASDVFVQFTGTTLNADILEVLGNGKGGASEDIGGLGRGAEVFVVGTEADISLDQQLLIAAEGFGGSGETGGDALGGTASLDILDTTLSVAESSGLVGEILIESSANAGMGTSQMGNATGGLSQLLVFDASIFSENLLMASEAEAQADDSSSALGGVASGGEVTAILEANAVLEVGSFALVAPGISSSGGLTNGGTVDLSIGGPQQGVPNLEAENLLIDVDGRGSEDNDTGVFGVNLSSGQFIVDIMTATALGDVENDPNGSSITAVGGSLLISGSMNIDVTGDFDIEFGQGSIIGGPSISNPTANIDITSQGTISIIGDNDNFIGFGGQDMVLSSRDIDIEDGARFGAVNLTLRSLNTDDPAIIGGDSGSNSPGPGEGYVLSQEEGSRIEVANFAFFQPVLGDVGSNDPDIIMRDITAFGSLDDGVESISINTLGSNGIIRVEGEVILADASSTDELRLLAPGGRIEVITPGGVAVVDSAGNPSGNLFLGADQIWAADSDMIALLQNDSNFSGRDDQLAVAASGSDEPLGYLRGGSVRLDVGSQLLVRNTGNSTAQGGILVGDGGLSISRSENTEGALDVFAYGARRDPNGTLITGEAFYREVDFNNSGSTSGVTSYTDESEFNDCIINTGECDTATEPDPDPPTNEEGADPAVVAINNPAVVEAAISAVQPIETSEQESDNDFGIDFPGLIESEDQDEEDDVDDPVASGGDSSLYNSGGVVRVGDDEGDD